MTVFVVTRGDSYDGYENVEYFTDEYSAKVMCYHLNRIDKITWEEGHKKPSYIYGYKGRECRKFKFTPRYCVEKVQRGYVKHVRG